MSKNTINQFKDKCFYSNFFVLLPLNFKIIENIENFQKVKQQAYSQKVKHKTIYCKLMEMVKEIILM